MSDNNGTIEDLFSDSGPFDESEVVKAIQPFIIIQKSTKDIYFRNSKMTAEERILVYGLAKKLLNFKGMVESEMITASELHQKTGIKKGTIDPTFKKLKDDGLLVGKGEYEIPVHKISQIINSLNSKTQK